MVRLALRAVVLFFLVYASVAAAAPMTYQFDIPYNYNAAPPLFGIGMQLAITVDNADISGISQFYKFSDITAVTAAAVNGTFAASAECGSGGSGGSGGNCGPSVADTNIIRTDTGGIPTLLLGNQSGPAAYDIFSFASSNFIMQLAQASLTDLLVGFIVIENDNPSVQAATFYGGTELNPQDITGVALTAPAPVPEPNSLALVGLGLVVLVAKRRQV
jgi:hypothetical protein